MTKPSLFRTLIVATVGTMIFGTATLASARDAAGRVSYSEITITKRVDSASPLMVGPGAAVSLNPEPLPPRQSGTLHKFGTVHSSLPSAKGLGEASSTMPLK